MEATELAVLGEAFGPVGAVAAAHPVRRFAGLVGASEREQLRRRGGVGVDAMTATRRIAGFSPAASIRAASWAANSSGVGWSSSGIIT